MKLKCELHICLTKSVTKVTSIKTEIIPQLYRKLLQEPSLNFLGCLPHKRSFNAYHVFSRSNDREKTRNNMVVTRSPQEVKKGIVKACLRNDDSIFLQFLRVSLYEFISGVNSSFYQKTADPIYLCNKLTK